MPFAPASVLVAASTALGASRVLDPAEVRQFFRIIDGQANHMDALISDPLDAGRIDAGTLSVSPEPTEVAALVDEARNTFLSGGARQAVRIDLPPDLPRVHADRQRIVQVLNNLLSNASRHSPESSTIGIGAVRDGVLVAVSVSDEGRGVPPELLRTCSRSILARRARRERAGFEARDWVSPSARAWARGSPSPSRWPGRVSGSALRIA